MEFILSKVLFVKIKLRDVKPGCSDAEKRLRRQ